MAQIVDSIAGTNKLAVDASLALRAALQPPPVSSSGGRYAFSTYTGLITTIAAHTSSAGHIFALRWGSSTLSMVLDYFRIQAAIVTDFTTLQQLTFGARVARSFSATGSGGTALTLTGDNTKLRTSYQTTAVTDARIATTGALTDGTWTLDTQPFLVANSGQPAASTTSVKVPFEGVFDARAQGGPLILKQNEGICVSNEILMGTAGTAVVAISAVWREMLNAEVPVGI